MEHEITKISQIINNINISEYYFRRYIPCWIICSFLRYFLNAWDLKSLASQSIIRLNIRRMPRTTKSLEPTKDAAVLLLFVTQKRVCYVGVSSFCWGNGHVKTFFSSIELCQRWNWICCCEIFRKIFHIQLIWKHIFLWILTMYIQY